jgi:hypothetical protein
MTNVPMAIAMRKTSSSPAVNPVLPRDSLAPEAEDVATGDETWLATGCGSATPAALP